MNRKKLKLAERDFLSLFPEGFSDPGMAAIGKRHNVNRLVDLARETLSREYFETPAWVAETMVKLVSRSSMISMFEKPKFRDFVRALPEDERDRLTGGLGEWLHGQQQTGFETMLSVLETGKIAKWSLMTILPLYFKPQEEVFVKPTTAKGVIEYFELDTLHYKPKPTWAFYDTWRTIILEMKSMVHPSLAPNNAAFTGFLMMTMKRAD